MSAARPPIPTSCPPRDRPKVLSHTEQTTRQIDSARGLGTRLDALLQVIRVAHEYRRYDSVWDLCCDHGYLGLRVLHEALCDQVVFVDRVPHIMADLAARLEACASPATASAAAAPGNHVQAPAASSSPDVGDARIPAPSHRLLTCDAASLRPPRGLRHLLVIAGLGGEQIAALVEALHEGNGGHPGDYLLCPANNPHELRTLLRSLDLRLESEAIVTEKGRQYEVIHVSRPGTAENAGTPAMPTTPMQPATPVTPVGVMWNPDDPNHRQHRDRLLRHYRNRSRGETDGRSLAIAALYAACMK